MVLLGLSILIASVSFLCYHHPPTSWACFRWCRPSIENPRVTKKEKTEMEKEKEKEKQKEETIPENTENQNHLSTITNADPPTSSQSQSNNAKAELDRKAMPPPPPPFKKHPPLRNPRAAEPTSSQSNGVNNDRHNEEDTEEPSAPSFPAMNSAQRATGGISGPPRSNAYPQPQPKPSTRLTPPPTRSPLPNRGPPGGTSSPLLLPPPTHTSIPTKSRRKVLLEPGHSPLDWARLSSSPTANLRGLPAETPYMRVPPSLLKQHTGRRGNDAWTVLGGKVYNITPYVPYHPGGGPELLKAAGRDGTKLFGEVHPWVNWEGMLENCLVGVAVEEGEKRGMSELEDMD